MAKIAAKLLLQRNLVEETAGTRRWRGGGGYGENKKMDFVVFRIPTIWEFGLYAVIHFPAITSSFQIEILLVLKKKLGGIVVPLPYPFTVGLDQK